MTDTINYDLNDVCANVRSHIPDFDMATYIMSCVRVANNHANMQAENTRLREKLGEILTIAADADDDVIAELAREGLGGWILR